MANSPIVYSYDDPGAPVFLAGPSGLREILHSCLVLGYSGKAAAGWSVVYDDWGGSGNYSITNASESGVLGLWHPSPVGEDYSPLLYVAEGMQSVSQPINGRSRAVSITDTSALDYSAINTAGTGHFANYRRIYNGMPWVVVANDQFAIVILERQYNSTSGYLRGNPQGYFARDYYRPDMLFFGAISTSSGMGSADAPYLGNFFLVGGANKINTFSLDWGGSGVPVSHFRYAGGGLVSGTRHARISPVVCTVAAGSAVYDMDLRPWRLYLASTANGNGFINSSQYGKLPGLYGYGDIGSYYDAGEFAAFNPGVESFNGQVVVDGDPYLYGVVGKANPVFISLSAGDWA